MTIVAVWTRATSLAISVIAGCGRVGFDGANGSATDDGGLDVPWPTIDGQWTWIAGPSVGEQPGIYGTLGVAAATNQPGARDNGAAWTTGDSLWMLGGARGTGGRLSDLWRFDVASGWWTWMHGAATADEVGTYGTKGVPSTTNAPGARNDVMSWVAANGDLWLFGGGGWAGATSGLLNDVWRYDVVAGTWTWLHGDPSADRPGIYGTQGLPAPANVPGARSSAMSWETVSGVWLFGGNGLDRAGATGRLGDLWRYAPASNLWTWVAGSDVVDQPAVHGMRGMASAATTPGGRRAGCTWTAPDELWLFGGSNAAGRRNDLWRYTISTGMWTWVAGPNAASQPGVYSARGTSDPANVPGARVSHVCWQDPRGNFWVFGGFGFDRTGAVGPLQDLWVYLRTTGEWTWVAGGDLVNQVGSYGTRGAPDPSNSPGSRMCGPAWAVGDGSLWLFGGDSAFDANGSTSALADLWRFAHP